MTATVLRAEAKAHRWSLVVPASILLSWFAYATADWTVPFPMVNDPVAARLVVNVAAGMLMLLPLYATYPELERTLIREVPVRLPRVCASVALAALIEVPTWTADGGGQTAVTLFCFAAAAGVIATTVIGELAWTVPLIFGVLAIMLDAGGPQRISHAMEAVPPVAAYLVLVVASGWFVVHGPRRFLT